MISLSVFLIIILVLFLLTSILLSHNRMRLYLITASIVFGLVVAIYAIDIIFLNYSIFNFLAKIGRFFLNWYLYNQSYLSNAEIDNISSWFMIIVIYSILYMVLLFILKDRYIGANPSIKKISNIFTRIAGSLLFLITTYSIVMLFLINIRMIIPLNEGFLSPLFNIIYEIKA